MTNGLNALNLEAYEATRDAVSRDPDAGKGSFEAITEWSEGAQAVTRARSFTIETDEPESLGGRDEQIDPMELLLASLGTCLTIGWVTKARQRDVDFRSLRIRVSAPFDLRVISTPTRQCARALPNSPTRSRSIATQMPILSKRYARLLNIRRRCLTTF